ncbi:YggT family protein [candidate division KSB1 bacterium]|nr:YggT family protein [candidate division KSB1 bacterium]
MFIISNFFAALASVIHLILTLYMYVIIARAVMSWFNPNPYSNIVRFIYQITDPVLDRVRRLIPPIGGLDLSPVVVIFAILFIDRFLVSTLRNLVHSL